MDLYILRHAIAAEREVPASGPDSARPLTRKGAKKMRRIASALKKLDISFDVILSSPFRRAKETAEIVAEVFKCDDILKFSAHLKVGGDQSALVKEINTHYSKYKSVLIVGHEPYLSSLIGVLLSGDKGARVTMKKGGICKLSIPALKYGRCATLEWLMAPAQILGGE